MTSPTTTPWLSLHLPLDDPPVFFTSLLSPHPSAILLATLAALLLPILLHVYLFVTAGKRGTPTILLLGPMGGGKTSFVKKLEQKQTRLTTSLPPTHTTQLASLTSLRLPHTIPLGSQPYRSPYDTSRRHESITYALHDTPGHGKLRPQLSLPLLSDLALTGSEPVRLPVPVRDKVRAKRLKQDLALRGVIFMVDAAALADTDTDATRDAATYLHDVLAILQARVYHDGRINRKLDPLPVLLAVSKQDLFTALPAEAVRRRLEAEIEGVRVARSKAAALGEVAPAAAGPGEELDVAEPLGGDERVPFSFDMLRENTGVEVAVLGGDVRDEEGVRRWEEWIGSCL